MKIASIVSTFPPFKGGIGNVAYNFSLLLAQDGHEVTVITPQYSPVQKKLETVKDNFKIIRPKPFFKLGNSASLPQLIFLLNDYDVVYLHYPFFGGAEYVLLNKIFFGRKKKLIIQYHMDNMTFGWKGFLYGLYKSFVFPTLFKMSDIVNVASIDYIKSTALANLYQNKKEKFRETHYSVDLNKFLTNYDFPEKKFLFVGGLDSAYHSKGLDVLLGAIKILKEDQDLEVKLDIIGNGNQKQKFIKLAKELEIYHLTNFTDNVSDDELIKFYRNSTALILPSKDRGEAFGIVLLEAMASGKPVIASNLPGVRSVFKDGREGFLVEPNNPHDLAKKMKYVWENPEKAKNMGMAGRELVEKKYDLKIVGKNLNKIFSEIENKK